MSDTYDPIIPIRHYIYKTKRFSIIIMEKKRNYWLLGIFLAVLAVRLILALALPNFTYESYFHLRQVEHITATGLPLYQDSLSYGGRELVFLPGFHYFMAFFDLFLPLEFAAKLIPNLLMTSLVLIVYLLSKKFSENETASLLAASVAGFLPITFTTNSFTPEVLFLPLVLLNIYVFLNITEKKYFYLYLLTFLLLSITSAATILLLIGFLIHFILSFMESKKINREELELTVFSLFFFIWLQFLFYKNTLLNEGVSFIWQNIPQAILIEYFPKVSIPQAILLVSIIPFVSGIYIVYQSLFKLKQQKAFLLVSFAVSTTLLTWFRLIEFKLSLSFFGLILAVLFALFYKEISEYFSKIKKIKTTKLSTYLLPGTVLLLLLTTLYPAVNSALNQELPSREEVEAFKWIKVNTPANSGVAALLEEGHLVTDYSERENLMDDQYTLIKDVDKRSGDLKSLFRTKFQTQALGTLDDYKINYLVFTPKAKERYQEETFGFLSKDCFKLIYDHETKIYLVKCELKS